MWTTTKKSALSVKTDRLKEKKWMDKSILTIIKEKRNSINITQSRLQSKKVIRDKEGHYIMIKGSVFQEDIIILNVYGSNKWVSSCMKQKLIILQKEIEEYIIIVGDFNTPLFKKKTSRNGQKISKSEGVSCSVRSYSVRPCGL